MGSKPSFLKPDLCFFFVWGGGTDGQGKNLAKSGKSWQNPATSNKTRHKSVKSGKLWQSPAKSIKIQQDPVMASSEHNFGKFWHNPSKFPLAIRPLGSTSKRCTSLSQRLTCQHASSLGLEQMMIVSHLVFLAVFSGCATRYLKTTSKKRARRNWGPTVLICVLKFRPLRLDPTFLIRRFLIRGGGV